MPCPAHYLGYSFFNFELFSASYLTLFPWFCAQFERTHFKTLNLMWEFHVLSHNCMTHWFQFIHKIFSGLTLASFLECFNFLIEIRYLRRDNLHVTNVTLFFCQGSITFFRGRLIIIQLRKIKLRVRINQLSLSLVFSVGSFLCFL